MIFDRIVEPDCVTPDPVAIGSTGSGGSGGGDPPIEPPNVDENPCEHATSGQEDDDRCSSGFFAAANPGLCLSSPRIIVRPSVSYIAVNTSIQFRAFLYIGGVEEEITENLEFQASNGNIAIGSASGSATGVTVGDVMVSATHGGISGFVQVHVVGSCGLVQNGIFMIFDSSKSSSLGFSSVYASRLDFAKNTASGLLANVDLDADRVAVIAHDASGVIKSDLINDIDTLRSKVSQIGFTQFKTSIRAGLEKAVEVAEANEFDGRKIAILFSDGGENQDKVSDLVSYANTLKSAGWIIMAVGLRATGRDFRLLEAVVTPGYLINAGGGNQFNVVGWLTGFKSYVCSGCPTGDETTVPTGKLNYDDFVNWDVIGHVDLLGKVTGGNALFDLLPGNGLYVDLLGSENVGVDYGKLGTKTNFTLVNGQLYRLTLKLAGNQRENRTGDVISINVFGAAGLFKTQTITINDWQQDFTTYTVEFTPGASDAGVGAGSLSIAQTGMTGALGTAGVLLDDVFLLNVDAGTTVLSDNFNTENPQVITPQCDDSAFFDCPAQVPDMSPLPDIECNTVPHGDNIFTSTQSFTAECPVGTVGADATKSATATSLISQADADAKALALATAAANAALECTVPLGVGDIINFHWLDYSAYPQYSKTGLGGPFSAILTPTTTPSGPSDFWNEPNRYGFGFNNGAAIRNALGQVVSGITCTLDQGWSALGVVAEALDNIYKVPAKLDAPGTFAVYGLPPGSYFVTLYGHGLTPGEAGCFAVAAAAAYTTDPFPDACSDVVGQNTGGHPLDDAWKNAPPWVSPDNFAQDGATITALLPVLIVRIRTRVATANVCAVSIGAYSLV